MLVSVFSELQFPDYLVGTAIGIVSFVGFLPDVFYGYTTGKIIDEHLGMLGYQYSFLFNAVVMFLGAAASLILYLKVKSIKKSVL